MSAASERLTEILRAVGDSRRRLEKLAGRLAAVEQRLGGGKSGAAQGRDDAGEDAQADDPRIFDEDGPGGTGVIDDAELNFEALDIEDSERGRG